MTPSLNQDLHEFRLAIGGPDEEIDLARAALVIARVAHPGLVIEDYLESLDALAAKVCNRISREADPREQAEALNEVLFGQLGLSRAEENYYNPANLYLNDVIDRKVGIPVSLSIVYLAVAVRAGIAVGGTAMPMHFVVKLIGPEPPVFIDCFNKGRLLGKKDCIRAIRQLSRGRLKYQPRMLELVSNRAILTRLMTNLKMIYMNALDYAHAVQILDRMLIANPGQARLLRERGVAYYRLGRRAMARRDLQRYLTVGKNPDDSDQILKLLKKIS